MDKKGAEVGESSDKNNRERKNVHVLQAKNILTSFDLKLHYSRPIFGSSS